MIQDIPHGVAVEGVTEIVKIKKCIYNEINIFYFNSITDHRWRI